jgi:heptosyltransferase-2
MQNKINKILVIRNDRFGEFLLNIPAIRALKVTYPQAKISLAVSPAVYELAGAVECADEVVVWDEQFRRGLRKQKFDACVILNPTKEAHWAGFRAGIPVRVGYNRKWGFLLTHRLKDTKHLGDRHEVDCNLELVGLIGAKTLDKTIKVKVNGSLFHELAGQKIVAIHPFTSDPVKQWPVERFKNLALRFRRELGLGVVIVGLSQDIFDMGEGIVNMVNKTSLVELAALLKRCSLLVSCDSGPMHLAAAVGIPVAALFRNDLPGKTAKRWGPQGEGHTVIEKSNLIDINVDEVFNRARERVT